MILLIELLNLICADNTPPSLDQLCERYIVSLRKVGGMCGGVME